MIHRLARILALVALGSAVGACASSPAAQGAVPTPAQPQPQPRPSQPPVEPECRTDADCEQGYACVAEIRAACDSCDGGPLVHVCRTRA